MKLIYSDPTIGYLYCQLYSELNSPVKRFLFFFYKTNVVDIPRHSSDLSYIIQSDFSQSPPCALDSVLQLFNPLGSEQQLPKPQMFDLLKYWLFRADVLSLKLVNEFKPVLITFPDPLIIAQTMSLLNSIEERPLSRYDENDRHVRFTSIETKRMLLTEITSYLSQALNPPAMNQNGANPTNFSA